MEHTPLTDEQLDMENLLEPGAYPAEVLECEEQVSKNGNPMLKLKLAVYSDTREQHVWDYISPHFMKHKYKHFFLSAGHEDVYQIGKFEAADLIRWQVSVVLMRRGEKPNPNDSSKPYPPKNEIEDYLSGEVAQAVAMAPETRKELEKDDDLPF